MSLRAAETVHFYVGVGPLAGALHQVVAHRGILGCRRRILVVLLNEHLLRQVIRVALLHLPTGSGQLVVLGGLDAAGGAGELGWRVDLLRGQALLR